MRWDGRRESSNVEDMRGGGGGGMRVGGVGIGTLLLAFLLYKACGIPPEVVLGGAKVMQPTQQAAPRTGAPATASNDLDKRFVSVVLADTEDTWQQIFAQSGRQYVPPKLVLFDGVVRSGCGTAQSAMGPFYCPADQKVYIDLSFFSDMKREMGITGELNGSGTSRPDQAADFARAYVIAHEVGHHVQTVLGISEQVNRAQARADRRTANALSVRQELQADCFAGIWANHTQQRTQFLENGDLQEAIQAAQQIGDDRLQAAAGRAVVPDSFTHGSSEQRMRWFQTGFQSGDVRSCDTFQPNV